MIDADRVSEIFNDCLFKQDEDTTNHVKAEGINSNVGFHPERLNSHIKEITTMVMELPDDFMQSKGGGMTFLNACNDNQGDQWTGSHQRMEQLFQLGIAIGKVNLLLPRRLWTSLPGGMPYYVVLDK